MIEFYFGVKSVATIAIILIFAVAAVVSIFRS